MIAGTRQDAESQVISWQQQGIIQFPNGQTVTAQVCQVPVETDQSDRPIDVDPQLLTKRVHGKLVADKETS